MTGTATFTTLESTIDRNGPASRLNWTSGPSVSGPAGCSVTVFAATAPVLPPSANTSYTTRRLRHDNSCSEPPSHATSFWGDPARPRIGPLSPPVAGGPHGDLR